MIAANTVKEIFFFGKPPTRLCEWMGASSSECEGSDPTKIDITVCSLVRKEKRFKTVKDRKPLICCLAIIANNLIWTRISFVGKECSSFLQVRESNCPEDSRYGNRKNTRPRLILQLLAWNRSQKKMKMKNKKKNSKLTKSKKKRNNPVYLAWIIIPCERHFELSFPACCLSCLETFEKKEPVLFACHSSIVSLRDLSPLLVMIIWTSRILTETNSLKAI